VSPRAAAHAILTETRKGAFADHAAASVLPDVPPGDRGLALEIAYGCLRLRARLDTWIAAFTDRPLDRVDGNVLDWLRIGTYQLRSLRTPDHAAVSETVRGARRTMDAGRAGFINAVLRAMAADAERDPFPSRDVDPVGWMTTWGSHPEWLIRRWLDRWPLQDVMRLVKHDNEVPRVTLRLLDDALPPLPAGVSVAPIGGWANAYELVEGTPVAALEALHAVIQDPAASAVVDYIGAAPTPPLVDLCSAPGTKAAGLAAATGAPVIAADISRARLARVAGTARRLGLPLLPVAADGRRPAVERAGTVLLDAPCTGTGVLRRRADARWRLNETRLSELTTLQAELLDAAAGVVERGGLMVYATCSLEREENEAQVEAFLARTPGWSREPDGGAALPPNCLTAAGDLFVQPWLTGTDGAFAARLRRSA
jgi:16S rRNA (cytosine967-C5)-methyltransferase